MWRTYLVDNLNVAGLRDSLYVANLKGHVTKLHRNSFASLAVLEDLKEMSFGRCGRCRLILTKKQFSE